MSTQKRISAPRTYNIKRKVKKWVTRVNSGPHNKDAIPLSVLLRDIIGLVRTNREARQILNQGKVMVDGRVRKDPRFPIGFLDVISIPSLKRHYRVIYDDNGRHQCIKCSKKEAGLKIVKINNKIRRSKDYQLTTNDGRTISVKLSTGKGYKTNDSLLISVPDQKVVKHLPFNEKSMVYIVGGKSVNKIGLLDKIEEKNVVVSINKQEHRTISDYLYVIGEKKEELKLHE
ncbi:30S ribosomal protein S4e [archaeon]|nr:30S ribosomal protein S4e [archaeon]